MVLNAYGPTDEHEKPKVVWVYQDKLVHRILPAGLSEFDRCPQSVQNATDGTRKDYLFLHPTDNEADEDCLHVYAFVGCEGKYEYVPATQ